jgi:hypothetical protein
MIAFALSAAISCGTLTPQVERSVLSVDPLLVRSIIANESSFNSDAVSRTGAQGMMQLEPGTARELKVCNSFDPAQNVIGGTRYLHGLLDHYHGNVRLAVAAYNAGPGAVDKYGGVPPYAETQAYVRAVLGSYVRYGGTPEVLTDKRSASASHGPRVSPKPVVRRILATPPAFGFASANGTNLAIKAPTAP